MRSFGGAVGYPMYPTRKALPGVFSPNDHWQMVAEDRAPTVQDPVFSQVALLSHAFPVINAQNPVDVGALAGWDAKWGAFASSGQSGRIAQCSTPPFSSSPYMYFSISNVGTVQFTRSSALVLGLQDFTIEFWIVFNSNFQNANIFDMRAGVSSALLPTIDVTNTGKILYFTNGATKITSSSTCVVNTPYHIAYVRSGGNLGTLWINGASAGTWTDSTTYIGTTNVYFMGSGFGAGYTGAFFDELRITVGTQGGGAARYTSSFTPPTQRFPDY